MPHPRRLSDRTGEDHQRLSTQGRFVIHTVGPVWYGGTQGEERLLASCYERTLDIARRHAVRMIAFPAISTGIYGYPVAAAARVAVSAIATSLARADLPETVTLCAFSDDAVRAIDAALHALS